MEKGLFNITSVTTTTLINKKTNRGTLNYIRMTNTHSSNSVTVDLFLEDSSGNKSHIANTSIPGLTTLLLSEGLGFNNFNLALKLETKGVGLSTSTPLSVIMK